MSTADRLDGRPAEVDQFEGPRGKKPRTGGKGNKQAPTHPVASDIAETPCYPWNDGRECTEPCSRGRKHICRYCGAGHRGKDCRFKSAGKGNKGKGESDNNGGGKGGGSKKKKAKKSGKWSDKSTA